MTEIYTGYLYSVLIAVSFLLFGMLMIPNGVESADVNEGSIVFNPHPDEELTPSGYPLATLKPGENTTFRIILNNSYEEDQRVFISLSEPEGWTTSVPGIVEAPSNGEVTISIWVEIPDAFPMECMNPAIDYPLRLEGTANITGDRAYTDMVVDLQANIDHELRIIPENVKEHSIIVSPGDRQFFDIMLTNTGEINDRFLLSVDTSKSGWGLEFREGDKNALIEVKHENLNNRYVTQILVSVPPESTPGEDHTFVIQSRSNASSMYDVGKRTDQVSVTFMVRESSSVSIIPVNGFHEAIAGEETLLEFDMIHNGLEESELETDIGFFMGDVPIDPWDIQGYFPETITLDVGEKRRVGVWVSIPEPAYGIHTVRLSAISGNAVVNPGQMTIDVAPIRNVTIESIMGGPFRYGENIDIRMILANNGYDTERAFVTLDRLPMGYEYEVIENPLTLEADGEKSVDIRIVPINPGSIDSFILQLIAKVPSEDGGWETASSSIFNVEFMACPDLNITRMVFPEHPVSEGKNITVNLTVENTGTGNVYGARLVLYEITFGLSNKMIKEVFLDLESGENITFSINWTADVAAKSLRATVDTPQDVLDTDMDNNDVSYPVYVNPIDNPPSGEGDGMGLLGSVPGEIVFVAVAGSLTLAGAATFVFSSDAFRYGFFTTALPLYSKLKPEHLLSNRLRRRIYVYVQNHPGDHFRSILLNLNLTNGTLAHHLYTLERESLIRSRRDGLYRRFYPAGYRIDESNLNISPIQRRIMDLVDDKPGLSQKEISRELDVSSSTVNYNIKTLKSKGMIKVVRDGKMTRIFREKDDNC